MPLSTQGLVLDANSPIDFQLHTVFSDGVWTPEGLLDHAKAADFGLIAITDHDRVDTVADLQTLAAAKGMPVLVAAELSTRWKGQSVDVLCFGYDPAAPHLRQVSTKLWDMQNANITQAFARMRSKGYTIIKDLLEEDEVEQAKMLAGILALPSARQPHELAKLLAKLGFEGDEPALWQAMQEVGVRFEGNEIAPVVEAVHADGGVCLIAHPGRGVYYPIFDPPMLDELRAEVPIDGFEAYYPLHKPEQTAMYIEYAAKHDLLVSAGSDSHGNNRDPIAYPAHYARKLLERVGVTVR
ncbi:MAG: PHP domain-containing protein [Chloroflexi bacterium]|nr:PHP domain-containing protein [Chloroflexota bacterium]